MRELLLVCLVSASAFAQGGNLGAFTNSGDVGGPSRKGSTEFDGSSGRYRITGSGANIWAKEDQFQYVWREMSGNFAVTATMQFLGQGEMHRKAGIMLRQSLDTDSPYGDIVIHGNGFGHHRPYTGDSDFISLIDETASPRWQAGYKPYNDTVTLIVHKWEDTKIVLGGFSGAWGEYNYTLAIGDSEQIQVWNPQSGEASAIVTAKIVGEATTTTLKSAPNPSADGEAVTFTAEVDSKVGAPPDGETVSFMRGKAVLGTGALINGSAIFITSDLKVGATSVTAVYEGDADFAKSRSERVRQVVQ